MMETTPITVTFPCPLDETLLFRRAAPRDGDAVLSLYRTMIGREFCVWDDAYPTDREIRHDTETGNLYVLCDGSEIVACLSVMPENELDALPLWQSSEKPRELARICVRGEYRGRGLAGKMVAAITDHLRGEGVTALRLSVARGNIPALRTYEKQGFAVRGEAPLYGGAYILVEKAL